jgi:EAL domain-containing protein (putative c-di-GMP-specific phosphodiesterase class I)
LLMVHELGIQGAQGYLLGRPSETLPTTNHVPILDTLVGASISQSTISILRP